MIKGNLEKLLNEQVNAELYSAYLYFAMSAYVEGLDLKGIAHWLKLQAQEEMAHAMGLYNYILSRGGVPAMMEIANPSEKWDGLEAVFEKVLSHEQLVTSKINNIATNAAKEDDHALYSFIQWYVKEQVEEEETANEILAKIKFVSENKSAYIC